jgi:SAM-dependent methyltransferase
LTSRALHWEEETNSPGPRLETGILRRVRDLYETHPYPHYPLLARPQWSSGYCSSLIWAQFQYPDKIRQDKKPKTLIAGCGEILPWVIEKWAPRYFFICSLDLSLRSLRRSYLRRWLTRPVVSLGDQINRFSKNKSFSSWITSDGKSLLTREHDGLRSSYCHQDLERFFLDIPDNTWNQIDAFGVIHHLTSPRHALNQFFRILAPGGVLRLMVYNSPARRWIWNIQRLFALLDLNFHRESDYIEAKQILEKAALYNEKLQKKLRQMGSSTLSNKARFSDTFFHPREVQTHPNTWREWIESAGFKVLGQFDRYGELDHLPNPLWHPPSTQTLQQEIDQGFFCGNLEYYLTKPLSNSKKTSFKEPPQGTLKLTPIMFTQLLLQGPPATWFQFPETHPIGFLKRQLIWLSFLKNLQEKTYFSKSMPDGHSILKANIPLPALQRLARLGYFSRHQLKDPWDKLLLQPLNNAPECEPTRQEILEQIPLELRHTIDRRVQKMGDQMRSPHFHKALEKRMMLLLKT